MSDFERARQEIERIKQETKDRQRVSAEVTTTKAHEDKIIRQTRIDFLSKQLPALMKEVNNGVLNSKGTIVAMHIESHYYCDTGDWDASIPDRHYDFKSLATAIRFDAGVIEVSFPIECTKLKWSDSLFRKWDKEGSYEIVPDEVHIIGNRNSFHSFSEDERHESNPKYYQSTLRRGVSLNDSPDEIANNLRAQILAQIVDLHRR